MNTNTNMNVNTLSALTEGTLNALIRDYLLLIALLAIVLLFALYIYFVQTPMAEYFIGATAPSNDKRRPQ